MGQIIGVMNIQKFCIIFESFNSIENNILDLVTETACFKLISEKIL